MDPTLSVANSNYPYTYNPASFAIDSENYLFARIQNTTKAGPRDVLPSIMGFAALNQDYSVKGELTAQNITFQPTESFEKCGTEDPRIAFSPNDNSAAFEARAAAGKLDDPAIQGLYYLMYTAYDCSKAQLALATTTDPRNTASWVRHGPLWPREKWSKSGAVLFRDQPPHYLIWGDSSLVNGLHLATSQDKLHWITQPNLFIETRPNNFDSLLVESGPPPIKLPSGDYIFFYNSARHGFPSVKPHWDIQYNVGYLILNGSDPAQVLERSAQPILSPTLSWELGNKTSPVSLTPDVVFVEAAWLEHSTGTGIDSGSTQIILGYGAADTDVGMARATITLT